MSEQESVSTRRASGWERGAYFLSGIARPALDRFIAERINTFSIQIYGRENLDFLKETPAIVVANHPTPHDSYDRNKPRFFCPTISRRPTL